MNVTVGYKFFGHPAVMRAGPAAAYWHLYAVTYCRRFDLGNVIPEYCIDADQEVVDALTDSGLWREEWLPEDDCRGYRLRLDCLYEPNGDRRSIPRALRSAVFNRDGHLCRWCGSDTDLHIDHVLPVVSGGTNDIENLQTLCASCNLSKGARI